MLAWRRMNAGDALALEPSELTILVVDDIEANRELLCRRFAKKGFQVIGVAGGEEALARVAAQPIDIVVLDINMPNISGLEVLRTIRVTRSSSELPIIMATARAQSESVVEALRLGANDYVTKPIDFPVLHARVMATLQATLPGKTAAASGEIGAGTVLMERYRLDEKIGAGAFGEVWKGTHLDLKRDVAIKVLSVPSDNQDGLARFRREGINACRVQHPNAVAVFDSGITKAGTAFLVMELLEGNTLQEEIRNKKLTAKRCLELMAPICDALHAAHDQDIVHRDVKPANIFLHGEVPKLLDFGLAKLITGYIIEQKITMDGWMVGTPLYMAPERFSGQPYCGRSDVYSIGMMLYQMLTGQSPFGDGPETKDPMALAVTHARAKPVPIRTLVPNLPVNLEALLLRSLSKEASERPHAHEMAAELRAIAAQLPAEEGAPERYEKTMDTLPTVHAEGSQEGREPTNKTVNLGAPSKDVEEQ